MDQNHETQDRPKRPADGIRIIGVEGAASAPGGEAFGRDRGEVVPHREEDEPSAFPRPVHRFPRPSSDDSAGLARGAVDPREVGVDLTQPLFTSDAPEDAEASHARTAVHTPAGGVDGETEPVRISSRGSAGRRHPSSVGVRSARTVRGGLQSMRKRVAGARASLGRTGDRTGDGAPRAEGPAGADGAELSSERGSGSRGEGTGTGSGGDDFSDWASSRAPRTERPFELGDLDDPDQTGPFQSPLREAPPSQPGQQPSSTPTSPRSAKPQRGDFTTRLLTGLGIGLAAVILFKLGSLTSLVLVLIVVVLAAAELFGVLRRAGYRPATLVGLVATVGILIGAYMKGEAAIPLVLGLVVVFTLLWYLLGVTRAKPTINIAVTMLAFVWVGFLGSFAALLLDPRMFPNRHGVALLLGATVATVGYDIGSFLVGARFGRHHLAPAISPNKTWEGLIGGTVASVLVGAVVISQISPWTTSRGIALGLVVAVAAPLGDLCESLLKRDLGIKDMGWILPGHGGVLDRVDALLFVVPATYYLVRLINFGG